MERDLPGFHLKVVILKPVPSILDLWALLFLSVLRSWVWWWVRPKVGTTISVVLCPSREGCWLFPSPRGSRALSMKIPWGQGLVLLGCVWQEGEEQVLGG